MATPTTQTNPTAIKEEDLEVLAEELEKYFFSPSTELSFSPIFRHLEAVDKHLSETFLTNLATSACL